VQSPRGQQQQGDNLADNAQAALMKTMFVQSCSSAPAAAATATPSAVSSPVDALQLRQSSSSLSAAHGSSVSHPSHVVPAGVWFGARLMDDADFAAAAPCSTSASAPNVNAAVAASSPSSLSLPRRRQGYCLVTCVVNPAFLFEEFELMQPTNWHVCAPSNKCNNKRSKRDKLLWRRRDRQRRRV
jgi:hypothetical protein